MLNQQYISAHEATPLLTCNVHATNFQACHLALAKVTCAKFSCKSDCENFARTVICYIVILWQYCGRQCSLMILYTVTHTTITNRNIYPSIKFTIKLGDTLQIHNPKDRERTAFHYRYVQCSSSIHQLTISRAVIDTASLCMVQHKDRESR